jgi:large subunit ribosomal protein L15
MARMQLNTMSPGKGAKRSRLRVGRGASAGQGKTSGRGVKGQRARKGGYHKVGFEGGQMPLQRRMPKVGFKSAIKSSRAEVRLDELNKIEDAVIDLAALIKAGVVPVFAKQAKVILSGELKKAVTLKGIGATKGALAAIEKAGGKLEIVEAAPKQDLKARGKLQKTDKQGKAK